MEHSAALVVVITPLALIVGAGIFWVITTIADEVQQRRQYREHTARRAARGLI